MKNVAKRCAKCNRVARVPERQRKCYALRFGKGSYSCWGDLVSIDGFGNLIEATTDPPRRPPQAIAQEKADRAAKKVDEYVAQLRRTATLLAKWQQTERIQRRLAARTDDEIEAERLKRKQRADAKPKRRAIKLGD
jgi:hypothetical protein